MSKYIDTDALTKQLEYAQNKLSATDTYSRGTGGGKNGLSIALQMVHKMPAADVEPVREWIPCSERLPEEGKDVLVYWEMPGGEKNKVFRFIDIRRVKIGGGGWHRGGVTEPYGEAVAWMPLPEPPKMDGGSE